MEICSKKDIKVITGIMAVSLLLGGCTVNTESPKRTNPQHKDEPKVKTEINLSKVPETSRIGNDRARHGRCRFQE